MNRYHREPTLNEILLDSIVRAVMETDGIEPTPLSRLVPGTEGWICASERILEIAGTTHLLIETPEVFTTNIAASPIESAIQRLRERIDLIGVATCRKGHDLTTEFVKPACASW